MDGEGGGRQPGWRSAGTGDACGAAAANANATIHKRRDAFTETTPICRPPPSFPSSSSSFCFSLLSSRLRRQVRRRRIQIRTPVRQTGLRIAMISRRREGGQPRRRRLCSSAIFSRRCSHPCSSSQLARIRTWHPTLLDYFCRLNAGGRGRCRDVMRLGFE